MQRCLREGKIHAILTEGMFENFYSGQSTFFELGVMLEKDFDFCGFTSLKFSGDKPNKLLWVDALFTIKPKELS